MAVLEHGKIHKLCKYGIDRCFAVAVVGGGDVDAAALQTNNNC